ncbi:MAG TPA: response regulator [Thermodesulfobacteriota bacterium]|nr:response regulator [Thermodesulfobacteriota bacterium]
MEQHILAVDDEPHMLKLLERIITEKTSYPITTTTNSLEVPKILEQNRFDLIITDLKMPGLDGIDLLRLIRENNRPEEVIIITAFGSLETAVEALSRGAFDYITKPFKKEQILFTMDRAMRWQKLKREVQGIQKIFSLEPYEKASQAFAREYVRNLAKRCADEKEMAARSGISPETIAAALKENPEKTGGDPRGEG